MSDSGKRIGSFFIQLGPNDVVLLWKGGPFQPATDAEALEPEEALLLLSYLAENRRRFEEAILARVLERAQR